MSSGDELLDAEVGPREEVLSPAQQVFQNDLLLDKILHFAMDNDNVWEQRRTTNSCKLVQRLWLERVSEALHKSPPAWYYVDLDIDLDRTEKFINTFANSPATRIPPYDVTCWFDARFEDTEREYLTLLNCITQCGAGFLKLDLNVNMSSLDSPPNYVPFNAVELYLPKLESVQVNMFSGWDGAVSEYVYRRTKVLLESVLGGAQCLTKFSLTVDGEQWGKEILREVFESWKLSYTLTTAHFHFTETPGLLTQFLLKNPLPNLTNLKIFGVISEKIEYIFTNELQRVLDKFHLHLKQLDVEIFHDSKSTRSSSQNTTIVLPVMKSLEVFKWTFEITQWSFPASASLGKHFPALKIILLCRQTYQMLREWFRNAKFFSVEETSFTLKPDVAVPFDRHDSQLAQQMLRLSQAFPNVVKLTISTVFTKQLSHIKFIFQVMRQLQELKIVVSNCPDEMSGDEFDCLFLGLRPDETAALRAHIKDWKTVTKGNMPDLKILVICVGFENNENAFSPLGWNFDEENDD